MSEDSAALLSNALDLPPSEREEITAALWDSLGLEDDLEASGDSELLAESNRRRSELQSGGVSPITHSELKRQLGL